MGSVEKRVRIRADEEEDRISRLPDELIHQILSFNDTRSAIQTSTLSKRWKLVWKTLPNLRLDRYRFDNRDQFSKFVGHVFSHRNQQSNLVKMELICGADVFKTSLVEFVRCATAQNVQNLDVTRSLKLRHFPLSIFSSTSLKKLKLAIELDFAMVGFMPDSFWSLPALTTLYLEDCNLPESCFNLPALTTLHLFSCKLPKSTWDLPALTSLELRAVDFTENRSKFFSELVNLQNLILSLREVSIKVCNISCLKLVNLKISCFRRYSCKFVVSSPKFYNFEYDGIVPIIIATNCLEKVNIKIQYPISYYSTMLPEESEKSLLQLPIMFQGLHTVKFLTLDAGAIKALSVVSDLLAHQPSPFCNLKYVKIPKWYAVSTVPSAVRTYLLSGSPSATIIREFPQMAPVSMTAQNMVIEEPLATPPNLLPVVVDVITRVDGKEAELVAAGCNFADPNGRVSPSIQTDGRDKGTMPQHHTPLVVQNVDYDAILVSSTSKRASRASMVEAEEIMSNEEHIWQRGDNYVLGEMDDSGEVEKQVKVHADKELVESQGIHIKVSANEETIVEDTMEFKVQEEHTEKNSGVDDDRAEQIDVEEVIERIQGQVKEVVGAPVPGVHGLVPNAPVAGAGNRQVSSSVGNSDFGLWQGHEVKLEFVSLLDLIMQKYPKTFEHFTPKSKKFYTMGLNMLCASVNAFLVTPTAQVNTNMIIEYRALFDDLQSWGFNVTWLVNRLNYIEQLQFSHPLVGELRGIDVKIEDAKRELQNLQALRMVKMSEIEEAFGHIGTSLAVGYVGDGLLSGH